jgi:metal-responsive CopG/Arc/MetJ family transcriptional regulator
VITITIPIALREELDAIVAARDASRSGVIVMAVRDLLERDKHYERRPDDPCSGSGTATQS